MTTLLEIEAAIERLSVAERAKLSRWWQDHFDPDDGLELRGDVAEELDAARQEIARGNVVDWNQLKQSSKIPSR